MASTPLFAGTAERSFRHDPRMRQELARLGRKDRKVSADGPAGTSLYWLLRSRRPKLAALTGRLAQADLLVVACALADCNTKLVVNARQHGSTGASLAAAGLDWILRSGDCLPCLRQVRAYDCLIVGDADNDLSAWGQRLGQDALLLGLSRNASVIAKLSERILRQRLAPEVSPLRDGRRTLLIANHEQG